MTRQNGENSVIYVFDGFRLDVAKRLVYSPDGEPLPLKAKAFETLLFLVENPGRVVERDELLSAVWPDTVVEENNLTQHISSLRRLFGERPDEHRFIATVPGHGYKFVAKVEPVPSVEPDAISISSDVPPTPEERTTNDKRVFTADRKPSRLWLLTLAVISLLALSSVGFFWWREATNQTAGDSIKSIAILPFKPLVAGQSDESLELGMADTLIAKIGDSDQLVVRPISAVRRFTSPEQDPIDAGRQLGVEAVLDGNIQMADGRVRVSAKLIRVTDGKQLWSGQFNEALDHIFAVQDSISERVATALMVKLGENARKRYTENVEAYQLYMRGNFHASRLILPEVQKAISYYEQALDLDPTYALAHIGIAEANRALILTSDIRPSDVMPQSVAAATRAVEIDNTLVETWTVLGSNAFWYDYDWKAAEGHYLHALKLNPNSSRARLFYAHLLSNIGRHEEAVSEIRRARELDPPSLLINSVEGQFLFFAGKEAEALDVLQRTIDMDPNFWLAHLFMSRIYLNREMYPEAIAAASRARDLTKGNAEATATVGYALAKQGRTEDALRVQSELEQRAKERYVPPYTLAPIPAALGDKEKALDMLEQSFRERDALMVFLKVEPKWDNLRSEPRFIELMKKMKFE